MTTTTHRGRLAPWAMGLLAAMLGGPGQAQERAPCGSEGGDCALGDRGLDRVYYGLDGRAVLFEVEGTRARCGNEVRGDFVVGESKVCTYEPVRNPGLLEARFGPCADEGGVCRTGASEDAPVYVRYGTPGRWIYDIVSGDHPCDNGRAGFDPAPGTRKICELGPRYFDATGAGAVEWINRGAEGQGLRIDATPTLVRYGAQGRGFVYRQVVGDPSKVIACTNGVFGRDPAPGTFKLCQVARVAPRITAGSGRWVRKKTLDGASPVRIETEIGFTWSDARSTTLGDAMSLCRGVAAGAQAARVESVAALCAALEKSKARTRVKGNAVALKHTDICRPPAGAQLGAAYQYAQAIDSACFERGRCAVTALTIDILCVYDPPGAIDDFVPRCRPGTCADAHCTRCSRDSGWLDDADRRAGRARPAETADGKPAPDVLDDEWGAAD